MSYKPPRSNNISKMIQIPEMFPVFPRQLYFSIFVFIHMGILPLASYSTKFNFSKPKHIRAMCVYLYIFNKLLPQFFPHLEIFNLKL